MPELALGFEYARVLNILRFSTYQGSEYVSDFEYVRILDIQGSEYARVTKGFEYARIIPEYA